MKPHVAIPVTDLNRSKVFYTLLGCAVVQEWQRSDWSMKGCLLEHPSGMAVELIQHPKNKSVKFPAVAEVLHVAFPVPDVAAAVADLERQGVTVSRPVTEGVTVKRLAFVKDPNGFSVELYEPR